MKNKAVDVLKLYLTYLPESGQLGPMECDYIKNILDSMEYPVPKLGAFAFFLREAGMLEVDEYAYFNYLIDRLVHEEESTGGLGHVEERK